MFYTGHVSTGNGQISRDHVVPYLRNHLPEWTVQTAESLVVAEPKVSMTEADRLVVTAQVAVVRPVDLPRHALHRLEVRLDRVVEDELEREFLFTRLIDRFVRLLPRMLAVTFRPLTRREHCYIFLYDFRHSSDYIIY